MKQTQNSDVFLFIRHGQTQNAAAVLSYGYACFLVDVVVCRHVEIDNVFDVFDYRPFGITCVQHNEQVELPDVEEVEDGADLSLGHVC